MGAHPNQFNLVSPTWTATVRELLDTVSNELGCDPDVSVKAHLHKLLLYEDGAHFKPHKDTEKEPGMFATFIICLPSEYKGGCAVTLHCGKRKVFDVGSCSYYFYISW